jgi:uncharacterized coiled-coil protein SlyX
VTAPNPSLPALIRHWLGTDRIPHLEAAMATAAEQINTLSTKVDGISAVVADVHADYSALVAAMQADRENLSASGQAALDAANAKLDDASAKLADLDVAVGDADGSDTPPAEPTA